MANTGCGDLVIVRRTALDIDPGRPVAVGALPILERAPQVADLGQAVRPGSVLVGTTNRAGRRRGPLVAPWVAAPQIADFARQGSVAILFGSEDRGLPSQLLARCGLGIRIPAAPALPSFNLAQAVLLVLYDLWRHLLSEGGQASSPDEASRRRVDLGAVRALLMEVSGGRLRGSGQDRLGPALERLLTRACPNAEEMALLRGLLQRCVSRSRRAAGGGAHVAPLDSHGEEPPC